ncbi:hypothetical protein N8Z24_00615 [bacterium]|nr:hypothetical protein [bacterium]
MEKQSVIKLIDEFETEMNLEYKGTPIPAKIFEKLRNRFMDLIKSLYSKNVLDFVPTGMQVNYDQDRAAVVVEYDQQVKKDFVEEVEDSLDKSSSRYWVSWTGEINISEKDATPYTIWKLTQTEGNYLYFALIDAESVTEIHEEIPKSFNKCSFLFILDKPQKWQPDKKSFYWVSEIKTNLYGDVKKDDKS